MTKPTSVSASPAKLDRNWRRAFRRRSCLSQADGDDGWWNRPHESMEQQARRARRVVGELIERHGGTDDRVAIVSHGGFYNFVLAELLGMQADNGFWFNINNTGITRFNFEARRHRAGVCQSAGASAGGIDHVKRIKEATSWVVDEHCCASSFRRWP